MGITNCLNDDEMKKYIFLILAAALLLVFTDGCKKAEYKALIVTGQNLHDWKSSYPVLKSILDESGLFKTYVAIAPDSAGDMNRFTPKFSDYNVVVIDYAGKSWSEETKKAFVEYVSKGGGVVIYHGSSIAFPDWKEYNEMSGLSGWAGRDEKWGPYVYYRGNRMITDTSAGPAGTHGKRREFEIRTRMSEHPVMKGLPVRWMHASDELYSQLRGPAENMDILATANSDTTGRGRGRDEPMLMTIKYGNGRVFHTAIGHADPGGGPAMHCAGFITVLQRGAEWAASGNVTLPVPNDFPTASGVVVRTGFSPLTLQEAFSNIGFYETGKTTKYLTEIQGRIREAAGDQAKLLEIEKMMTGVLKSKSATTESKKLMLRELSWMGTDFCIPVIKENSSVPELKDEAEFALERLNAGK
jgi:type 1 glutamine amidotransferase